MLNYEGENCKLIKAAVRANNILYDNEFYERILAKEDYEHLENCTPEKVVKALRAHHWNTEVFIREFYYANPMSLMLAVYNPSSPDEFKINLWNLNRQWVRRFPPIKRSRDLHSVVGTLVHEFIHVVDGKLYHMGFGHGDNTSHKKANTFPYYAGKLAQEMSRERN